MHVQVWMLFVLALSLTDNCDAIIPQDTTTLDDDGKHFFLFLKLLHI